MKVFIAMIVALILPLQFVAAVPAHATSTLVLSNISAAPGTYITVQAQGLTSSQQYTLSVDFSPALTDALTADANGDFSYTFQVPGGTPAGQYTVSLYAGTTATGSPVTSQNFTVSNPTAGASLSISPAMTLARGEVVTVNGSGLPSSTQVFVDLPLVNAAGTAETLSQTLVTSSTGTFSATFTLPSDTQNGQYTVTAYQGSNASGALLAATNITVGTKTAITLTPSTGPAGTTTSVTVAGTGFGSNETVTINYTATLTTSNVGTGTTLPESKQVETDTSGAFSATLPVPSNIVPGTYTVTATGTTSGLQATAVLTITPQPAISLNPTATAPGTVVVVTGQLFAPNLGVTVSATIPTSGGNVNLAGQTTTDAAGAFTSRLFVPANAVSGDVKVTATESQAPGGASSATATLTIRGVQGAITASPLSAAPGTIVSISGSGFAAGPLAPVTITASIPLAGGGSQVVSTTKDTDTNGTFTGAELLIPANAATGGVTLSASQPSSGATATTVIAIVAPSPTPTTTPTATPTPSPTATSTPTATPKPTSTPTVKPPAGLHFQRLSVWYHVVRVGTFNHIDVQANLKTTLGIWVHVLFPSGRHWDFYQHTDHRGHWARSFDVPYNTTSPFTNQVHIELQLWKGKATVKNFIPFTLIP